CAPAFLDAPTGPTPGTRGCSRAMAADQPSYRSDPHLSIAVSFAGLPAPKPRDRLALYPLPRKASQSPSEANPIDPTAWAYIGGGGHESAGAPGAGVVVLDGGVASPGAAWPPPPGLWVVFYVPALADGSDGHTPVDHILVE